MEFRHIQWQVGRCLSICPYKRDTETLGFPTWMRKGNSYQKLLHTTNKLLVRFEVFTVMTMKNAVLWDVAPCRYCVNRPFGRTYRLHLQGIRNPRARNQREQVAAVCSPQRECLQRGNSQDHNYCTSIPRGIKQAKKTKVQTYRRSRQKSQESHNIHHGGQRCPTAVEACRTSSPH
jgi:hypothetical protein